MVQQEEFLGTEIKTTTGKNLRMQEENIRQMTTTGAGGVFPAGSAGTWIIHTWRAGVCCCLHVWDRAKGRRLRSSRRSPLGLCSFGRTAASMAGIKDGLAQEPALPRRSSLGMPIPVSLSGSEPWHLVTEMD